MGRFRDSVKLPALFYLEMILAHVLVGFAASVTSERLFLGLPFVWLFCVWHLWKRVDKSREEKGSTPAAASFVFLFLMAGPPLLVLWAFHDAPERFNAKAHQSEAKIALAALYGANKSFFREYSTYHLSFEKLGYAPEMQRRFYTVGPALACAERAGLKESNVMLPAQHAPFDRPDEVREYFRKVRRPEDCKDPKNGYELFAVGVIRRDGALDVWSITDQKVLTNVQAGL